MSVQQPGGGAADASGPGAGGRVDVTRYARWAAPAFLGLLAFPVAGLLSRDPPGRTVAIGLAGLALFGVLFVRTVWAAADRPHTNPAPASFVAMVAVSLALLPVFGTSWLLAASYYVTGVYLLTQPRRRWLPGLAGVLAADVVIGAFGLRADVGTVVVTGAQIGLFGGALVGFYWLMEVLEELRTARAELARAAMAHERLRIARDLHDVLGQRLTLVALKTQLAARVLRSDPDWAEAEMAAAQDAAREALDDVRATVSGYRRASLASELDTARTLLRSAGVGLSVSSGGQRLPDAVDEAAAWVIREGATNVLRHASARRCTIRIQSADQGEADPAENSGDGRVTVSVADDGPRQRGGGQQPEFGNGLTGLRERVEALGGTLTVTVDATWFTVEAELPAAARAGEGRAGEGRAGEDGGS